LIFTLRLFQILNNYSYRETLEKAENEGFNVPSLCNYHYRVKRSDDEVLKSTLEEYAKLLLKDIQILVLRSRCHWLWLWRQIPYASHTQTQFGREEHK
jgi:hypothetical protein